MITKYYSLIPVIAFCLVLCRLGQAVEIAPFTYCATTEQVINVTYLYITDNSDGSDACADGQCKFYGGHIYTLKGEGCGGHNGELITSLRFAVTATSDLKVLGLPIISNYGVINGDLCSFMVNTNETNIHGHEVSSCPVHAPACATIQYTYQALGIPIPVPYSEFLSFRFQTQGRVWINTATSGQSDDNEDAAICVNLPILYIPTTPTAVI